MLHSFLDRLDGFGRLGSFGVCLRRFASFGGCLLHGVALASIGLVWLLERTAKQLACAAACAASLADPS